MIDLSGYKLTFDDEFSGNTLSRTGVGTNWGTVRPALGPSATVDHYFGDAAFVDAASGIDPFSLNGGALTITAAPAPSAIVGSDGWASGLIQTANSFSQLHGYFEIRADIPTEAGAWPAFWLLPANGAWPPEIDVLETYGGTTVHQTVHSAATGTHLFEETITPLPGASAGFHTYGVLWTAEELAFYIDGQSVGVQDAPADIHQKMYLLVDLAINDGAGVSQAPKDMIVDYVRAYSNDPNAVGVDLGSVSSPDGVDTSYLFGAVAANAASAGPPAIDPGASNGDTLVLRVSGDAWQGNAQFVVSVDGRQLGDVQIATAIHAKGEWQEIRLTGDFASDPSEIGVRFVNDAWGGSDTADRNLYVDWVSLNGNKVQASDASHSDGFVKDGSVMLYGNGSVVLDAPIAPTPPVVSLPPVVPAPSVPEVETPAPVTPAPVTPAPDAALDTLVLRVSGDAWQGNAQFTVSVDGEAVGGVMSATAVHAGGEWQEIGLTGDFGSDPSKIAVSFVNDAWGGSDTADRNLYVDWVSLNGNKVQASDASHSDGFVKDGAVMLYGNGSVLFGSKAVPAPSAPAAEQSVPDTLVLRLSGDAWQGDAEFTIAVDGHQVGGVQSTSAVHADGEWQEILLTGDFRSEASQVSLSFVNDAWGGSSAADRNLYVDWVSLNGNKVDAADASYSDGFVKDGAVMLYSNGSVVLEGWF